MKSFDAVKYGKVMGAKKAKYESNLRSKALKNVAKGEKKAGKAPKVGQMHSHFSGKNYNI